MRDSLWVKFGPQILEHDKTKALANEMSISIVESAGYIALLVALGISNADDSGVIDSLTDKTIEKACYWQGAHGELVASFIAAGVLTGIRDSDTKPLTIDADLWFDFAASALKRRVDARARKAKQREAQKRAADELRKQIQQN